ncbi:MAG: hypothetical protein J2P57_19020 [Acidimicrobiaceae bacterium]|nr:hypothetical protein [Acidimicrobiaceae bacterium]
MAALNSGEGGRLTDGTRVLHRPALVHTLRCRDGLDVAWCSETRDGLEVRHVQVLSGHRVARPRLRCPIVVVAEAGAFERWKLQVGDLLTVTE